jgi:AraC-like DNA-binding protein
MKFDRYIPSDQLKPYIDSFAIHETPEAQTYKVLPGTGLVIGFQYKGKLSYLENEKEIPLSISGITGLQDRFRIFKNSPNIGTILVFFKEAGASVFFKQPLHELFRESISLDNFMLRSELLILEEQLYEALSDEKRIKIIEQFLLSRMKPETPDPMIVAALSWIHSTKGNVRMTELAKKLNSSQSAFEKKFRRIVGASPKKFASVVRMKTVLQRYNPEISLTVLGYESGFYDQAHFIKEFKTYTGVTPEKFFNP